nr:BTAD domain-containing putative transcriptional regulator [Streptomyces sp. DSM 41633]
AGAGDALGAAPEVARLTELRLSAVEARAAAQVELGRYSTAVAALEPRALIAGNTAKAERSRAVLREALRFYGAGPSVSLGGFIDLLDHLPADVSALGGAQKLAAELAQNLRAATVNDPLFGGTGTAADPGVLLTPSPGYRARVSVISMVGLTSDQQREGFVNQLQMALFAWIKRNPAGDRPLGGLLVMDEAQNFAPSSHTTASTHSTLALSSQA